MVGYPCRTDTTPNRSVCAAATEFEESIASPNTRRAYGIALNKLAESLGEDRPLCTISGDEIATALELLWGDASANTWNARRSAIQRWLIWCHGHGWDAPDLLVAPRRCAPPLARPPVRSRAAIEALLTDRDIHLRERALWRMMYETCAHAGELLQVNIEQLDQAGRSCPVGHGGDHISWQEGTARLLPFVIRGRTRGPLFVTHRRSVTRGRHGTDNRCPETGRARLSYDRARDLLDAATATNGAGTGWKLSDLRHSGLAHLAAAGMALPELMSKSRHRRPENVRRYFRLPAE